MAGPSSRSLPWRRRKAAADLVTDPNSAPAAPEPAPVSTPAPTAAQGGGVALVTAEPEAPPPARRTWRDLTPLLLIRAAHPAQTLLTALGVTVAAALTGRPGRELALVLVTVLVGQAMLGWANDLFDRARDAHHRRTGKPVSDGRLSASTTGYAVVVALLLVVPLAIANGLTAGASYLIALTVALLGTFWPRRNALSWVPWAVSFGLLPAFLSYGGWGGHHQGDPPSILVTVLAALLGIGVHVLVSLWGLVADHEDGWHTLPLRLGRRLGTQRLLVATTAYLVVVVAALALVGAASGLSR